MATYSKPVEDLIAAFARLPGIGNKSAERIAFHVLRLQKEEALGLSEAIRRAKECLRHCSVCFNITDSEVCDICGNSDRDSGMVCVVEQPKDLLAMESTDEYRGVYHVLLGHISPLEGIGPDDLTIKGLLDRIRSGKVREIILATNPDREGDSTAFYLSELLREFSVSVTQIARGIPTGSQIDHVGKTILMDALKGRQAM